MIIAVFRKPLYFFWGGTLSSYRLCKWYNRKVLQFYPLGCGRGTLSSLVTLRSILLLRHVYCYCDIHTVTATSILASVSWGERQRPPSRCAELPYSACTTPELPTINKSTKLSPFPGFSDTKPKAPIAYGGVKHARSVPSIHSANHGDGFCPRLGCAVTQPSV